MKIATWNINSVRLRLETVLAFLQQADIDVLCLQETKTQDMRFPAEALWPSTNKDNGFDDEFNLRSDYGLLVGVGKMKEGRAGHAITSINVEEVAAICD